MGKQYQKPAAKAAMSNKRQYSVSTPNEYEKDGETKTFWTNIGRAFETDKGIMVHLNALPVSSKIYLSDPPEKTEQVPF